jgi:hypothetical protein
MSYVTINKVTWDNSNVTGDNNNVSCDDNDALSDKDGCYIYTVVLFSSIIVL